MNSRFYEEPITEIIRFSSEDTIVTSSGIDDNFGEAGSGDFD